MRDYHSKVRQILVENPATRDDDMLLYGVFLEKYRMVAADETFYMVCRTAKYRKLPSYESISRARRKIQEETPSLQGTSRRRRKVEEEIYHDYYSTH